MRFLRDLKVSEEYPREGKSLFSSNNPGGSRICEWLRIDDKYSLSVQASESHYCTPRALLPLDKYEEFEIAIIYDGCLTCDIRVLKEFPRYEELMEFNEGDIFAFVPKNLIEDLYCWWINSFR
ncbi:MAG: hypothetical protein SPJ17_05485 [Anaeroplasma sp.]|uniref:hypothetical protein n=1 Tax=Anaeroplasma sp. TaxID=1872523 RepID=UPI002A90C235|nr:hypothetical protein [Anaeroplasma sp.]MDY5983129.1 hypothetical protein [Anaeroplasma sp.]